MIASTGLVNSYKFFEIMANTGVNKVSAFITWNGSTFYLPVWI